LAGFDQHVREGFRWKLTRDRITSAFVCTSRFWFNYRLVANTLSVYHTVRRL
ncbi:unnamed protein product, partial [Ascophyllum nodosum]